MVIFGRLSLSFNNSDLRLTWLEFFLFVLLRHPKKTSITFTAGWTENGRDWDGQSHVRVEPASNVSGSFGQRLPPRNRGDAKGKESGWDCRFRPWAGLSTNVCFCSLFHVKNQRKTMAAYAISYLCPFFVEFLLALEFLLEPYCSLRLPRYWPWLLWHCREKMEVVTWVVASNQILIRGTK